MIKYCVASGLCPVSGHGEMGWTKRMDKVPNCTTNDIIKGVHVFRQRAGAPKSRYPLKSVLKLPRRILGPRKWMAHIVQPIPYITSFEVRVGGCGDLLEGWCVSSTRKIPITDPNWSSDYPGYYPGGWWGVGFLGNLNSPRVSRS